VQRTELQHPIERPAASASQSRGATPVAHQTVRLARGRHASPHDGVCVMELASILGGEPFTDSPAGVSPIVAALLRAYNDAVDDDGRQDLYEYASRAVGTRAAAAVEHRRAERCLEVLHGLRGGGLLARLSGPWSLPSSLAGLERLATRVARELRRYGGDARALALADELIAMSAPRPRSNAVELPQLAAAH
jgi:hypothetical protein